MKIKHNDKFDQFLCDKFAETYHGPKGGVISSGMVEAFETWVENLNDDEMIELAIEFGRKYADIDNKRLREACSVAIAWMANHPLGHMVIFQSAKAQLEQALTQPEAEA